MKEEKMKWKNIRTNFENFNSMDNSHTHENSAAKRPN